MSIQRKFGDKKKVIDVQKIKNKKVIDKKIASEWGEPIFLLFAPRANYSINPGLSKFPPPQPPFFSKFICFVIYSYELFERRKQRTIFFFFCTKDLLSWTIWIRLRPNSCWIGNLTYSNAS